MTNAADLWGPPPSENGMRIDQIVGAYNDALFDTDRDLAHLIAQDALALGMTPEDVVFTLVIPALDQTVNKLNGREELCLAQHFMISQISSEITEQMIPKFTGAPSFLGTMVIGTARGDIHTLGKRIVMGCLKARMVHSVDLGVNVAPERFVDEAVAADAQVIGISAMMIHTARGEEGCSRVREILNARGLADSIKLVVGGAPFRFDQNLYRAVGADAWAADGMTAGSVIMDMIKEGVA
jgi:methanogenic corrinoid protein MtbC1